MNYQIKSSEFEMSVKNYPKEIFTWFCFPNEDLDSVHLRYDTRESIAGTWGITFLILWIYSQLSLEKTLKKTWKKLSDPFLDKYEKQLQNGAKTWTMLDTSGGKTVNNFEKILASLTRWNSRSAITLSWFQCGQTILPGMHDPDFGKIKQKSSIPDMILVSRR